MSPKTPSALPTSSRLAAFTFFAKQIPSFEAFGSNGLPLTPKSISILGRSQLLKDIQCENLCQYLDIVRGKHERLIVVSEHFGKPVNEKLAAEVDLNLIATILYQTSNALDHLWQRGIAHHNLEPSNILLDDLNNVKLFNYGLFYMTNSGQYVSFPVGKNVKYLAPERILGTDGNIKSDVWSLGIITVELVFGQPLWQSLKLSQVLRKILSFVNTKNVLEKIANEHGCLDKYQSLVPAFRELLEACLSISSKDRPTPAEILQHPYFESPQRYATKSRPKPDRLMDRLDLKILYYLYLLAGGDVEVELKKQGLVRNEAPILSVPRLVLLNGQTVGETKTQSCLFDDRVVFLSLNNLTERLATIPKRAYYPLLHAPKLSIAYDGQMQKLPIVIRERDTEYQFYRVVLFERLLKAYPATRDTIVKEAAIDIPPLLRGHIWACILWVLEDSGNYERIDKVTPTPTDRQIDVDIPRCHQYNELLASPTGHAKLKRLLKSWVASHPQYVYWQGLDSLTAPFLYLNFNNEERAFNCLYKFIPKYLHGFFLKDNSLVIKEYLSKFSQLTTYHEPVMARHMKNIHFIPELFAIPWFLTMFSHVFPIHKIIHLWDKLILGDDSYPLYIGISVLKQLKSTLLSSGFNECILLFSDLPDIVMETSMIESQKMYEATPPSICCRKHALRETAPDDLDIEDVVLADLQAELCPRISANDLVALLKEVPNRVAIVDLRSQLEFNRIRVVNSINIPFTSVSLSDIRLDSLNVTDLDKQLANRIVVIVSISHENAVLFSKFLVDCEVSRVCVLHKGFRILQTINPSILMVA